MSALASVSPETKRIETELIRCPKDLSRKLAVIGSWQKKSISELIDPLIRSAVDLLFVKVHAEMKDLQIAD